MSRIIGFDRSGKAVGEVRAACSRAWGLNSGGETTVQLADSQLAAWMDFGRTVLVEHPRLPAWGGVIDDPWGATLPVEMTIYDAGYLLSRRTPTRALTITGTAAEIALRLIEEANRLEDLRVRMGVTDNDDIERTEEFEQRPVWDLLKDLATRAGKELLVRSERDTDGRMITYIDLATRLGVDTNLLLHDGPAANLELVNGSVEGEIFNRVTGLGDQSSKASLLASDPQEDADSITRWGLRSQVIQFSGVTSETTLKQNTIAALAQSARPKLKLTVNALDVGDTFEQLRPGNSLIVHAAGVRLPGGARGWRGRMRIHTMAYDEARNVVGMTLEATI